MESKSHLRYQAYKDAETFQEIIALSLAARFPAERRSESRLMISSGIMNEDMPGNESRLPGHIYDAVELAREYSLKCYSQELEEQCKTYAECMATLEDPDGTDLFQRAILHGYVLDGSYTFLDQRRSQLALTEKCMNENLFLDPINNTWHACPKTKKQAITGPDSERWKASMEKELGTIEKMGVWKETSYLPKGGFPLPCNFVYKLKTSSDRCVSEWNRIWALGNLSKEGIHYESDELSSSVFTYDSLRTLISMATANEWGLRQLDCTGAYLNGILDRPIYLIHPLGKVDDNGRPIYLECRKTIYGLKQSGF